MPLFEYWGLNAKGGKVSGRIDGPGRQAVAKKLRQQGIFPTDLHETVPDDRKGKIPWSFRRRHVAAADLASATRQMATLLSAGLPLDETLATVAEQTDQAILSHALAAIREEVMEGGSLHDALAGQGAIFPDLFISMVHVGENSGTLDRTLQRLADFLENQARIRSRIQAALAYPLLMTVVGAGVLIFLFTFVVPKITRMLHDMNMALPWPTRLLISATEVLAGWWWLIAAIIAAGTAALLRYRATDAGRLKTDEILLRLPLYGRLHLLMATAWFSRTLATLLHSGVPLLMAMQVSSELLKNQVLYNAIVTACRSVREGGSLAATLKESAVFPAMLAQVTAAGEKSGRLEEMLLRVAETYEHQTDMAITGLLALLEPLIILLMGTVVGFVVLAILLPIFQASQGF